MSKIIAASVGNSGKLQIALQGFVGNECIESTKQLHQKLAELGLEVEVTDMKMHGGGCCPPTGEQHSAPQKVAEGNCG